MNPPAPTVSARPIAICHGPPNRFTTSWISRNTPATDVKIHDAIRSTRIVLGSSWCETPSAIDSDGIIGSCSNANAIITVHGGIQDSIDCRPGGLGRRDRRGTDGHARVATMARPLQHRHGEREG